MNILVILGVGLVQTIFGAFWYSPPLFGKFWMQVTGFDKLNDEQKKQAGKEAGPLYGIQIVLQLVVNTLLYFVVQAPNWRNYTSGFIGFIVWLGFLLPIVIQMELWGTTPKELKVKKVLVVGGQLLISTVFAGIVFGMVK